MGQILHQVMHSTTYGSIEEKLKSLVKSKERNTCFSIGATTSWDDVAFSSSLPLQYEHPSSLQPSSKYVSSRNNGIG